MLKRGGGISCDGLKQTLSGGKYYDLVIHFVNVDRHYLTVKNDVSLQSRVLVLVEHRAAESAEEIQENLEISSNERFVFDLSHLMKNLTLVTDWAAILPDIVGESALSARVTLGWKWLGGIVQKLNTTFVKVMESEKAAGTRLYRDLKKVKEIFRIFKAGGWNNALSQGSALY